jgi:hypothetical protein
MNATVFPPRQIASPRIARARNRTDTAERAEPNWARPALIVLLLCTAAAYLWDLSASGYANSFYAHFKAAEVGGQTVYDLT